MYCKPFWIHAYPFIWWPAVLHKLEIVDVFLSKCVKIWRRHLERLSNTHQKSVRMMFTVRKRFDFGTSIIKIFCLCLFLVFLYCSVLLNFTGWNVFCHKTGCAHRHSVRFMDISLSTKKSLFLDVLKTCSTSPIKQSPVCIVNQDSLHCQELPSVSLTYCTMSKSNLILKNYLVFKHLL